MQAFMKKLPERYRQILAHVSPDVDVFHFLALAWPNIINYVKVLEISTEVVSKIDAMGRIAACCSPVGGVSLKWSHSGQTQSVLIPVLGGLVHRCVYLEGNAAEFWKTSISRAPWHASPESMRCLAQTSGHSKLRNCFHWNRKACRCHFWSFFGVDNQRNWWAGI